MFGSLSRRLTLKYISALGLVGLRTSARTRSAAQASDNRLDQWDRSFDRVFLGGQFWANPMEDWRIHDGWAECLVSSGKRNIQSLTHQIVDAQAPFAMSVRLAVSEELSSDEGAGFRIGVRSDLNEYKSNCFAPNGINAAVVRDQLVVGSTTVDLDEPFGGEGSLELTGTPGDGGRYDLVLKLKDSDGQLLGEVKHPAQKRFVTGNIAIASQIQGSPGGRKQEASWRFTDWRAEGDAIKVSPSQRFGPILWTQYTLNDTRSDEGFVLKLSALLGPMGSDDSSVVELMVQESGEWKSIATAELDPDASLATFRVPHWDETKETSFTVVYREQFNDESELVDEWSGKIKANPVGRPLKIGALTCQNDYAFPYAPVAENLVKLDPDLLYFSGDQLYENHGGFGVIRRPAMPAILNYLRKFYQHGWAFREAMRDRPTVSIPDDHDVFQGNYWGEGGAAMDTANRGTSSVGGYIQPVRMVNVVHRTCTAHHPEPDDKTAIKQGMSVYYGELVYGGVGFAILGDRQFKSGPDRVDTGPGRADHVTDVDFDTSTLDEPGLVLLGERQESFLKRWGSDWRGHTMKVLLSQTPFVAAVTHHGKYDGYLKADLDSNSWPQTPRNRAVKILRESMALHINGDQHLTNLAQYGVDEQRDSNWSFCTPAIAAGYPRWWRPDEMGFPYTNRPLHGMPNTGEYLDGFGNKVYVFAVGNPEVGRLPNRYEKAHQKGSGFGFVTIDTEAKTYVIEAYRFLIDASDKSEDNLFPGWPVTIHQEENRGENRLG